MPKASTYQLCLIPKLSETLLLAKNTCEQKANICLNSEEFQQPKKKNPNETKLELQYEVITLDYRLRGGIISCTSTV